DPLGDGFVVFRHLSVSFAPKRLLRAVNDALRTRRCKPVERGHHCQHRQGKTTELQNLVHLLLLELPTSEIGAARPACPLRFSTLVVCARGVSAARGTRADWHEERELSVYSEVLAKIS